MNFSFISNKQADELISQLQIGQIIKVDVLEKTSNTNYLISYQKILLTAVSEIDLRSKSVWLKVTQKVPFAKMQLIIEENYSNFKKLFEYAIEHKLILPNIPESFQKYLNFSTDETNVEDLFNFLQCYSDKIVWGIINESHFVEMLEYGITYKEILSVFSDSINIGCGEKKNKVPPNVVLEKINTALKPSKISISLLHIKYQPSLSFYLPMESIQDASFYTMMGTFTTKHFGKIAIVYNIKNNFPEIKLYFENNIYINALKDTLYDAVKNSNVKLHLCTTNEKLEKPSFTPSILEDKNPYDKEHHGILCTLIKIIIENNQNLE